MSEMQVAAIRGKGGGFWTHLGVATVLSLAVPYLGLAYLGLKSSDAKVEWQRRTAPIGIVVLIVLALPHALSFELAILLLAASSWALAVAFSIVSLWRAALRKDSAIAIAPGGFGSLMSVLGIALLIAVTMLRLDWPEVILFRATEATPTVAEGELLYGLKYTPSSDGNGWSQQDHSGGVRRGHLVLARIAGKESLVRVLAVQGDIFAVDKYALLINGSRILLGGRTVPWTLTRMHSLSLRRSNQGSSALSIF